VGVIDVAGMAAAGKLPTTLPGVDGSSGSAAGDVAVQRVNAAAAVLQEAYLAEGYVFTRIVPQE